MPIYGNRMYPYTKEGYKDYKQALIAGTGKPTGQAARLERQSRILPESRRQ